MEPALTDPDNRRPVDFEARACLAESLPETSPPAATQLLSGWPDGRIKLHVTRALFCTSAVANPLFESGSYAPLAVKVGGNAVAFMRQLEDEAALALVSA